MDAFLRCMQTCSVEWIRTTDVFEYIFCLKSCFLNEDFFLEVKGRSATCVVVRATQCRCCGARWRVTSHHAATPLSTLAQSLSDPRQWRPGASCRWQHWQHWGDLRSEDIQQVSPATSSVSNHSFLPTKTNPLVDFDSYSPRFLLYAHLTFLYSCLSIPSCWMCPFIWMKVFNRWDSREKNLKFSSSQYIFNIVQLVGN